MENKIYDKLCKISDMINSVNKYEDKNRIEDKGKDEYEKEILIKLEEIKIMMTNFNGDKINDKHNDKSIGDFINYNNNKEFIEAKQMCGYYYMLRNTSTKFEIKFFDSISNGLEYRRDKIINVYLKFTFDFSWPFSFLFSPIVKVIKMTDIVEDLDDDVNVEDDKYAMSNKDKKDDNYDDECNNKCKDDNKENKFKRNKSLWICDIREWIKNNKLGGYPITIQPFIEGKKYNIALKSTKCIISI